MNIPNTHPQFNPNLAALKERMRRHHWHRYFELLRLEHTAANLGADDLAHRHHEHALYHRKLAENFEV